jgi:hypothetical protein
VDFLLNADVSVVVGADWQGVRTAPNPTLPLPSSTTQPTGRSTSTTTTVPATDEPTTTTSTTITGIVPETPQDVHC